MSTKTGIKHTPGKAHAHPKNGRKIMVGDQHVATAQSVVRNPPEAWANAEHTIACWNACEGINPEAVEGLMAAMKLVCHALAADRDGYFPAEYAMEELKYMIVDRAIELAEPGFDGGETTSGQLASNIAEWRAALSRATPTQEGQRK